MSLSVTCGVPQGSVLGPLLFLIYVNDIGNVLPTKTVKLFADDTNIFIFHQDISMINTMANEYMSLLSQWFVANKLSLNTDKTCFITLANQKVVNPDIRINNLRIANVDYCKYLGLYIDQDLKWTIHIDQLCGKLQKLIGIFYKLRNKLPLTCLKTIYFAFVHPHLLFGVEMYANTGITHLSKLITLNNKILRILQNKSYSAPVKELYIHYNTLPVTQLHKMQLLLLVHKCVITTNICYPRFIMIIFSQIKVCIVMKPGIKPIFIYIALTQYLGRDVSSLKALCNGMSSLSTLKIFVLLISSNPN